MSSSVLVTVECQDKVTYVIPKGDKVYSPISREKDKALLYVDDTELDAANNGNDHVGMMMWA